MPLPKLITKILVFNSEGQVLLVRRSITAPDRALTWEFPGGIVEHQEDPKAAALRELSEEAGIDPKDASYLFAGTAADYSYTGIFFYVKVSNPTVTLSYEHDDYKWLSPLQARNELVVEGYKKALDYYINFVAKNYGVWVSAKALISNNNQILLLKRADTDKLGPGNWDLPGGGLEQSETIFECIERELKEEVKLNVNNLQLVFAHTQPVPTTNILRLRLGLYATTNQNIPTLNPSEHSTYKWLPKGQAYDFANHPNWPGWGEFVKVFG